MHWRCIIADGVPITAGTGTNIATDDRGGNHVQLMYDIAGTDYSNGQVAPTTTAATLVAANAARKSLKLFNTGSVTVWIGKATVTTANGFPIPPWSSIEVYTTALIQGITQTGTGAIAYFEEFNS